MTITEPAPAKINLALHIRRKRADGYHDLETLFAFARDGDVVAMDRDSVTSLTITGPFAAQLNTDGENIMLAAVSAFQSTFQTHRGYRLTLDKQLPIASGIGGGSADAAATLRVLAQYHGVPLNARNLQLCAASLGADVPACLLGETAYATGRGDDLAPLPPLGDLPLLLINPRVPLSTASMFAAWDGIDRGPLPTDGTALNRARAGRNDFTAPAIAAAPVVAEVLTLLDTAPGCAFARLSGSGATCFGLFADESSRDSAATAADAKGWWTLRTHVR